MSSTEVPEVTFKAAWVRPATGMDATCGEDAAGRAIAVPAAAVAAATTAIVTVPRFRMSQPRQSYTISP
jgi:hypothetical protein